MIYTYSIVFIFINSFILQIAIKKDKLLNKWLLINAVISIICVTFFPIPLSVWTLLNSIIFPLILYKCSIVSKLKMLVISGLLFFSLSITFIESFLLKLLLVCKFSINKSIILSYLIILIVNICAVPIIRWVNLKIKIYDKIVFIISILFFFIYPMMILLLEVYDHVKDINLKNRIIIFDVVIMLILIFFLCIALFIICKLFLQKIRNDYQIKMQTELIKYTTLLEKNYDKLRFFKHDYANILLTLEIFIRENDMENLQKYYFDLVKNFNDFTKSIPKQIDNIHFIKDKPLKSIIFDKLNNADNQKINAVLIVKENITFNDNLLDLCRVLGILLDNSIEAANSCVNDRFIYVSFVRKDNEISISIKNSYKDNLNINDLYKNGYTTKGRNHGQGLEEVRYIVNQHKNWHFNIKLNKKMIIVNLSLREKLC